MSNMTRRLVMLTAGAVAAGLPHAKPARAATVLRWSTVVPNSHPEAVMMNAVAADVRAATGGAVDIQVFPAGQLGSSHDTIEAVSSGALQMVIDGPAACGQFLPVLSVLEAPYLWRDVAHVQKALASPLIPELSDRLLKARGMRILGGTYYGTRHLTTGSRPVASVGDMKGFKLRIPEVETYRTMVLAWGARPTPLNLGELYLALSQGAVDGQENPLPTINSSKFYEVQKHLVLTGHIINPRLILVNQDAWAKLDTKAHEAIQAALAKQVSLHDAAVVKQERDLLDVLKKAGMQVTEPDVESFRKPVLDVMPAKYEAIWGKGMWNRIESL